MHFLPVIALCLTLVSYSYEAVPQHSLSPFSRFFEIPAFELGLRIQSLLCGELKENP